MIKIWLVTADTDTPRRADREQSLSATSTGTLTDRAVIASVDRRGRPRGRRDTGSAIGAQSSRARRLQGERGQPE